MRDGKQKLLDSSTARQRRRETGNLLDEAVQQASHSITREKEEKTVETSICLCWDEARPKKDRNVAPGPRKVGEKAFISVNIAKRVLFNELLTKSDNGACQSPEAISQADFVFAQRLKVVCHFTGHARELGDLEDAQILAGEV